MSRPRTYDEERVGSNYRLPRSLHERLKAEAEDREVSVNLLIERAISDYLERLLPLDQLLATAAEDRTEMNRKDER